MDTASIKVKGVLRKEEKPLQEPCDKSWLSDSPLKTYWPLMRLNVIDCHSTLESREVNNNFSEGASHPGDNAAES